MTILIYMLMLLMVIGFIITIYLFFKFFASFLSLVSRTNEVAREAPWGDIFTGGFFSMWRVLRHQGNAHAGNALLRNGGLLICSLVLTMGAAWMLSTLNSKYCVIGMTTKSSDGAVVEVCKS